VPPEARPSVGERAEKDPQRPLRHAIPGKLTMMRGENCMEASVSVHQHIAKTIETTVMIEAAMPPRMTCATCGR